MARAKLERPKYRPFPKLRRVKGQVGAVAVDVSRVKEMYLAGNGYSWKAFCQNEQFDPDAARARWYQESVVFEEWKREWVKKRTLMGEEETDPLMVDTRKLIAHGRIKFVQEWSAIAKNMKALLVHLLNEHVGNAASDQKIEFAQQVMGMKKLKLDIGTLSDFAAAGNRIAELEARALFLPGLSDPNFGKKAAETDGDGKGGVKSDEPSTFDIIPMGAIMNANDRTKTIAAYFDQHQAPQEPIPVTVPAQPALPAPEEEDAEDPS